MSKIQAKPVWVSDVKPVSVNGRVHCWNVSVRFNGDLALWHDENLLPRNIEEFKQHMKWTNKDVEKMEDDDVLGHKSIERLFFEFKQENAFLYRTEIPFILDFDVNIPQRGNISTVKWDEKSKVGDNKYANTLVGYVFLKGWFDFGRKRAERFRKKMLSQIAERNR